MVSKLFHIQTVINVILVIKNAKMFQIIKLLCSIFSYSYWVQFAENTKQRLKVEQLNHD